MSLAILSVPGAASAACKLAAADSEGSSRAWIGASGAGAFGRCKKESGGKLKSMSEGYVSGFPIYRKGSDINRMPGHNTSAHLQ